jgi:hypothetical protein
MTHRLARISMAMARACLGNSRREWSDAMEAEFDIAARDGKALAFAIGCLAAACREVPRGREGRLGLASYALAFGLLIPVAASQLTCAMGFPNSSHGPAVIHGILSGTAAQSPFVAHARLRAVPALSLLWLLLGVGHLRLAWLLLDREWRGALNVGALLAAAMVTLFLFMEVLLLDVTSLLLQGGVLAVELGACAAAARYHWTLSPESLPARSA